jgi:hypothetical protein
MTVVTERSLVRFQLRASVFFLGALPTGIARCIRSERSTKAPPAKCHPKHSLQVQAPANHKTDLRQIFLIVVSLI